MGSITTITNKIMTLSYAMNVARRLSSRNEADLLQETYVRYSEQECQKMAQALSGSLTRLPKECRLYVGKTRKTNRHSIAGGEEEKPPVDPFAGLPPGEAAAAKAARLKGRSTHAVLQRRMTRVKEPPSRSS